MCFSAEVSFSLAGALTAGGGYCIYKAMRMDRAYMPLAMTPIVFGVQQFCEGWVWTGTERGDAGLAKVASLWFLFFALFFWPTWIPYTMLLIERSRRVRLFLRAMTALGLGLGLALMVPLTADSRWLALEVTHHSIHYNIGESPVFNFLPGALLPALYLIVVSTPLFVSSIHKMIHAGVAVIVSAAATRVFFDYAFASVWCFFAAALSLYLCLFFAAARGTGGRARRLEPS